MTGEVKKAISQKCYTYEDEDLDTSTARILKSVIGKDVSAHFRTDGEKYVDNLIPLKKAAEIRHQKPEQFLSDLSSTLKNVHYEVQELSSSSHSKKESYVVIRDINTTEVAESITELKPLVNELMCVYFARQFKPYSRYLLSKTLLSCSMALKIEIIQASSTNVNFTDLSYFCPYLIIPD